MTLVMSPDSSYGRYDAPTQADNHIMGPVHKEREPELHIGRTLLLNHYLFTIKYLCTNTGVSQCIHTRTLMWTIIFIFHLILPEKIRHCSQNTSHCTIVELILFVL